LKRETTREQEKAQEELDEWNRTHEVELKAEFQHKHPQKTWVSNTENGKLERRAKKGDWLVLVWYGYSQ
jgi:hypothetical protein